MELTIIKRNDVGYIDSREVAEIIGKRHDNLIRDIDGYLKILNKSTALNFEGCNFFVESSYLDIKGRARLRYLITKAGCSMVANKLTGEKGVLFTAAYVLRFEQLETAERERETKVYDTPRLSEFNTAVRNVSAGMSYSCTAPHKVMDFLCGVYNPLGIAVTNDDYGIYKTATEIAEYADVYSDSGRPHARAISAIIAKLDILIAEHAIAVPYGMVGVSLRYDIYVELAVLQWLIDNEWPDEIPHLGYEYHVNYGSF